MNPVFRDFLSKRFTYNYKNGPNLITSEQYALREGVNCIGLMHLLLKSLFNIELPSNLRVIEMFTDNPYFKTVKGLEDMQIGDVLFLGRRKLPRYISLYIPQFDGDKNLVNEGEGKKIIGDKHAGYHTVMFTGEKDENGNPLVIDIQKATDKVRAWKINELMEDERYEKLYKIKRIRLDFK